VRRTEADLSLARELLGYEPAVGMKQGLARTVEHIRAMLERAGG
jgi:nucleoside-diphosphate-sugar epimerase